MPSILVIEDEPEIRELLRTNLEVRGFGVEEAADGAEAIDKLFDSKPDVVLLDLMMPEIDGFDVLEFIRGRPESQYIPVILLTALSEEADRIRGLSLGAQDYVVKPFSIDELMLRVKTLTENRDRESKLIEKSISDPVTGLFNARYLNIRLPSVVRDSHGEMSVAWITLEGAEKAISEKGYRIVAKLIQTASGVIRGELGPHEEGYALGGGVFAVISYRTGGDAAEWEVSLGEALREHLRPLETGVAVSPKVTVAGPRLNESSDEFLDRVSSGGQQTSGKLSISAETSAYPQKKRSVAEIIAERHRKRRHGLD